MKRFALMLLCAAVLALCLSGCGKGEAAQPSLEPGSPETAAPEIAYTVSEVSATRTQHVTQTLTNNRSIDADAVVPQRTQFSAYTLKRVDGDPERLFDIFSPGGHGSYTREEQNGYVVYSEDSGKNLVVREDAINYRTYQYETDAPIEEISYLMYCHTLQRPQAQPHDLGFMTLGELEAFGRDILSQLGVAWEPELTKCITLSAQEVLDFQREMFGVNYYGESEHQTLTQGEDVCYLEFSFSYVGIPLLGPNEPTVSYTGNFQPPFDAKATMLITADGLQEIDVSCACAVASASQPQELQSLDAAIAAVKRKYEGSEQFGELTISDIWLEYIPVQREEGLVLTPYWCFLERDRELSFMGSAQRINALTGKDLSYGG